MRCPKCNKEGAYIRIKTKDISCRMCGAITPIKSEVDGETKKIEKAHQ